MTSEIVKHDFNGNPIRQRVSDDYVSLTDMAKAEGRRVGDFLDLPRTKEFIAALAINLGVLPEDLVRSMKGSRDGTFAHSQIAMKFAQWVSIPFELWATKSLVKVVKDEASKQTQEHLPPADIRIDRFIGNLEKLGIDISNPRFNQELQDFTLDKILGSSRALPESKETWAGVAEIAEEMGYQVSLVTRHRSQLGIYVATCRGLQRRKEKRLCNGTQRDINLYLDCDDLRASISEFMDAKVLAASSSDE